MTPLEQLIRNFQELVAQVPEVVQPFVVMLAGAIPFIEGEGASMIGIAGGLNPIITGIAAAAGNFLCVLVVVALTSRARTAVVDRRSVRVGTTGAVGDAFDDVPVQPESKGRQRLKGGFCDSAYLERASSVRWPSPRSSPPRSSWPVALHGPGCCSGRPWQSCSGRPRRQ